MKFLFSILIFFATSLVFNCYGQNIQPDTLRNKASISDSLLNGADSVFYRHLNDCQIAFEKNNIDTAYASILMALQLKPDSEVALKLKSKIDKHKRELEQELYKILSKAEAEFINGNYKEAEKYYKIALNHDLKSSDKEYINNQLAVIKSKTSSETNSTAPQVQRLIIEADKAFNAGKYQEANDYYQRALRIDQKNAYVEDKLKETQKLINGKVK